MARNRGRHAAQRAATTAAGHRRRGGLRSSRYRRGLGGTAIAAVVMAALTASQAPGVELGGDHGKGRSDAASDPAPGDDSYETELPPLESPRPPGTSEPGGTGDKSGIPASVLAAYKKAAESLASRTPGCGLRWELLAGIGKVESGHARGGAVDKDGTTLRPILGPVLNGQGFASIKDTDGGKWDGDTSYDRAVGPLQFIPGTWNRWGADGNGDGRKDPDNIHDAALAAGDYLCAGGRDLSSDADLDRAILSYNNSSDYLRTVLAWYEFYRKGTHSVPDRELSVLPTTPGVGEPGGSDKRAPERGGKSPGKGGNGHDKPHKPSKPSKPSRPGNPGGGPGGGGNPGGPDKPGPSPEPTKPHAIERVGAGKFTAMAGEKFVARPAVKAETSKGKGVKGVKVRFEIRGDTEARFEGGVRTVDVTTGADGVATAPTLDAGGKAGSFTVRATAPGKDLGTVDFAASVTAPQADKLTRTSDAVLEAAENTKFAQAVEVKATRKGKAVANTPLTATLDDTDKGPYFKDAKGNPVRSLAGLETDSRGIVKLPDLFADDQPGTYTLTLKADGGATLEVTLTIKG
ncbi:lytic transglycosylase domain-containing protein [Streptomyces sp. 891-h]|uniref:lytic transglycosylase domain-containing protein n=1 Tax=Streptomyces sp. 891-h TaxID=2720714 RepID=UPI001FAA5EEF|nr:lytic transglycosylase domain-containing protein [Streptomyces sp. 891-h]UNZ19974.1 lytic transglycosylase domain-containing protein [Streptomyces sp. 891-h]